MTSSRPAEAPTPEQDGPVEERKPAGRRTVQLAELAVLETVETAEPEPPPPPAPPRPEPRATLPTTRDDWLRLAERLVGDWTATLRAALALALLFLAMVVSVAIAYGLPSAAATTAVGVLVFAAGRRRGGSAPE